MSTRRVIDAGTFDITRHATPTNPLPRHPDPTEGPEPHPTVIATVMLAVTSRDAAGLYEVIVGHHRWTYPPTAYVGLMTDDDAGRILCDAQRSDRA
jgi:hypothetical protein